MKTRAMDIKFPLRGVSRRVGYCQESPYASPYAVNVRPAGPLETRRRGGSRPGLTKVASQDFGGTITALQAYTVIDGDGERQHNIMVVADGSFSILDGSTVSTVTNRLLDENGDAILTEDGDYIVFGSTVSSVSPVGDSDAFGITEMDGKLILADSTPQAYDPNSGIAETLEASDGTIPSSQPHICTYRGRLALFGDGPVCYFSRLGDKSDWDLGADIGDQGKAVAISLEEAGIIGEVPTTGIPYKDSIFIFGCENSLWMMHGDPVTGKLINVSRRVGILSRNAYCITADGILVFLSDDGLYMWGIGSNQHPTRFSEEVIPESLIDVDPDTYSITMEYDNRYNGVHLFTTPATGSGSHWWLDMANKSLWPVVVPADMQPVLSCVMEGEVIFACRDGYLRKFSTSSTSDDGTTLNSHVLIGPLRISGDDLRDGMIAELHAVLADSAGEVDWRIFTGDSAEEVTDTAVTAVETELSGGFVTGVEASGTWE